MATTEAEIAAPSVTGTHAESAAAAALTTERQRRRKPQRPDDFDSDEEFLSYIRETYDKDRAADEHNRAEMVKDHRFMAGEQWDDDVRQRRDSASKPTLTINRLPAYVELLVGNRRMNDIGIKVIPDIGGTRRIAEIREGLIRNIQSNNRAQYTYDKAFEQQVIGGLGNFQIHLDYAHDDVFEQDIRIVAIPNPLAVVWDYASVDPTGADARHVYVTDRLDRKAFARRYPDAHASDFTSERTDGARSFGWDTEDTVQIVSFWRTRSETRTVGLMRNGSVEDLTDLPEEVWWDQVRPDQEGFPLIREVQRRFAEMYLCSAVDILAGPYKLPIQRVPVFRVPAWELFIEGDRIRWGLIRHARDPQKLHNYWRSTIAEKLVGSPKAKWVAADSAVSGREEQWRRSHLSEDPLLIFNADSGAPPTRVPPTEMEAAMIEQAGVASQDIRDVLNIHEASMGVPSNEVSGRAIMARQRVGEVGKVIYQDNLNMAIEEAGKTINQLIPFVYDTNRVIKILGEDLTTEQQVEINNPADASSDITLGKYSISVVTGPSYTTRRVEAREEMMALVNAMPNVMAVAADEIVEAQDWPGAAKIAKRIRSQLPPGMIDPEDMDAGQQAQQQAQQQAAQQQAEFEMQAAQLELALKQAQVREAEARAAEAQARAEQALSSVPRNLAGARQAESAAVKNIADIERNRVETSIRVAESLAPQPAGSGAR